MKKWLWVALPLLLGTTLALLLDQLTADPVLFLRASASTAVFLLSLLVSLALLGGTLWQERQAQQQRAWQSRLRQAAAQDRRRFLQRLDHELKNPITAMRAGLANITATDDLAPQQAAALASIEAQALRLSRLTADLRKIAELENRPLETGPIDLTQLLQEVVALVRDLPDADGRSLALTVPQAPWPLPQISGDRDLLILALYNLLENAVKFTQPADTIELRAREDGRFVIVEVADTGPGIEAAAQDHVWEDLYRGQGARGIAGSGLGLSLVKAVVERHGGRVSLHSRPGQGTLVSLTLPTT